MFDSPGGASAGREPEPGLSYDTNHRQVSADYLKALGVSLRQGRYFDEHDRELLRAVTG